ncbi:MAG: type II toxin-antitoxin system VapC family toxin [Actinomycetota bacterium]
MLYLVSSAIVKLVVREPETSALVGILRSDPETVSSVLARVEVLRAVRRAGARRAVADRALSILRRVALVRLEEGIVSTASNLRSLELRTLDAIHLATALSLGPALGGFVTYDARLASAARAAGLTVQVPR